MISSFERGVPPAVIKPINDVIDQNHLYTPLHLCILYNKADSMEQYVSLFRLGADPDGVADRTGRTPAQLAMMLNRRNFFRAVDHLTAERMRMRENHLKRKIDSLEISNEDLHASFESLSETIRKRQRNDI